MTRTTFPSSLRADQSTPDHALQANFQRPRLHHVPRWFRLQMVRNYRVSYQHLAGEMALRYIAHQCGGESWLDHWGSAVYLSRECFVSQPYNLSADRDREIWCELDAFSKAIDLPYVWSGRSDWFPPSTTSVIFFRPSAETD